MTFSVAADGTSPFSYQWYKDGCALSGATGDTYILSSAQSAHAGVYRVVVSNVAGSVTSDDAVLAVTASASAPVITTQPTSQAVAPGGSVTFTAAASGSPAPAFQWQKGGANISGATSASYNIANVAAGDAGSYTVLATNSAGSVTSNTAVLTVSAAVSAPVVTTQPTSQAVAPGGSVTFTVAASGSPAPTFQWQKGGANISGATSASYNIANVAAGDAGNYTVVATNSAGPVTSNTAVLTVSASVSVPVITTQPASRSVTASQAATFSVGAAGGAVCSYQWQRKPAGSSTWEDLNEGGSYRGVETATLSISSTTAAMSGDEFRCVTTNSAGTATTNVTTLTVAATAALLQYPAGIARDSAGNLFVADASSNTILKITAAGVVTTFAGTSGSVGSADGTGASARFNQPSGVAVDAAGNVYVADAGNATIRMITPAGAVTTLAGSTASRGSCDGTGTAAWFNQPNGIAVDTVGNVYVTDALNATVRKITSAGAVTTLAGSAGSRGETDGNGAAARFNFPSGVAVDAAGNVYVADTYNDTIRKVTPVGTVTTVAGSAGITGAVDLTGTNALFNQSFGVAVDAAGNVYVADTGNAIIRRIAPSGAVTTVAGMAGIAGLGEGVGDGALFNQPHALVVDGAGNLFVADTGNAAIRRVGTDATVTTMSLSVPESASTPPPVSSYTPPPSSGNGSASASGGGGGGATSSWFIVALLLLRAIHWATRRR